MRILIVDDNASMRTLLTTLLTAHGYEIVGSLADGNVVMETIRKLNPEIVCLDFQLPGRDGLSLLQEINTTYPAIDVLFMTASEKAGIQEQAADAGATGFLRKPFGQKQVLDELRQVCDTRSRAAVANHAADSMEASPDTEKQELVENGTPRSSSTTTVRSVYCSKACSANSA